MEQRNESMMTTLKNRKTNRFRRIFFRNGALVVGSSDSKVAVLSIKPREVFEDIANKITIRLSKKVYVKKVSIVNDSGEQVFSETISKEAIKVDILPNLKAGSYKFEIETNKKVLQPGHVLKVNKQIDLELKAPLFAIVGEEVEISWKSEQNKLVFYDIYESIVEVEGTMTDKYTYSGKVVFPINGSFSTELKFLLKKVTKTVVVLERYPKLYNMFPTCGVLTDDFDIELIFNNIVPKELISEISFNSVVLGEKYVFKDEQITQKMDVYTLKYDGSVFFFDPNFKLKVKLNDEQKTEIASQNFTMYRPSTELNQPKLSLSQSEFEKDLTYTVNATLNIGVDFTSPQINIYSFAESKTTYTTVQKSSTTLYVLNNISIPFFGVGTFILNSTGREEGVCCYTKNFSTINMPQVISIGPTSVTRRQPVVMYYLISEILDMDLVEGFVMVMKDLHYIIHGTYIPEKSSIQTYAVEFNFELNGTWYPYVRYKQIADFAYLIANAKNHEVTVSD